MPQLLPENCNYCNTFSFDFSLEDFDFFGRIITISSILRTDFLTYFDIISEYRLHKSVSFPFNVTGSTQLRALGWVGQLSAEYKCREV